MPDAPRATNVTARRRRPTVGDPLKKITLQLSESVVAKIKNAVAAGEAASTNVFVEVAVREKLRELRRAKVYAAYEAASRDPAYMLDLTSDMEAYDATLSDAGRT